jgi:hypothetical protein
MPASRLEPDNLLRLCRAGGRVRHHLRRLRLPGWLGPLATPGFIAADGLRLALHVLTQSAGPDAPLVDRGERAYLLGTLESPWYLRKWKREQRDAAAGHRLPGEP